MRRDDHEQFDFYPALGVRLRELSTDLTAPAHLKARVQNALARESARQHRTWRTRLFTGVGAVAVAVAIALLIGREGDADAQRLAREARLGLARANAMESSDSAALVAWLETAVGYRVDVPAITGARLVGASVAELGSVRGAAVVYRYHGAQLTYFALPGVVVADRPVPDGRVTSAAAQGYEVALWLEGGTARAVAASMPRQVVLRVAEECRSKAAAIRRR